MSVIDFETIQPISTKFGRYFVWNFGKVIG